MTARARFATQPAHARFWKPAACPGQWRSLTGLGASARDSQYTIVPQRERLRQATQA